MIKNTLKPEIATRIKELIQEANNLPAPKLNAIGWLECDMRKIIFYMLNDCILERHLSSNAKKAIEEFHWNGDVLSIYQEINNPKHPIRNYLIRNETDRDFGGDRLEFEGY